MARSSVLIAALVVVLVLGGVAAVVTTAIVASTQVAVIVGVISAVIVPTATALLAVMQGMYNNSKLDKTQATLQEVKDAHQSLADRLSRNGNP